MDEGGGKIVSAFILIVKCPDAKGIVAAVSTYLAGNDASITESNHFNDALTDQFYMRVAFRRDGQKFPRLDQLKEGFEPIARRFRMNWELFDTSVKPKVLIAVSRFGHCLFDL